MASTVYAMYLQSLIQQQAAARDAQAQQAQQDAAAFDQMSRAQEFAFKTQQADFERKFKIAELYGKTAAMTGEAPPKLQNEAFDEVAGLAQREATGKRAWDVEDYQYKEYDARKRAEVAAEQQALRAAAASGQRQLTENKAGYWGSMSKILGGQAPAKVEGAFVDVEKDKQAIEESKARVKKILAEIGIQRDRLRLQFGQQGTANIDRMLSGLVSLSQRAQANLDKLSTLTGYEYEDLSPVYASRAARTETALMRAQELIADPTLPRELLERQLREIYLSVGGRTEIPGGSATGTGPASSPTGGALPNPNPSLR